MIDIERPLPKSHNIAYGNIPNNAVFESELDLKMYIKVSGSLCLRIHNDYIEAFHISKDHIPWKDSLYLSKAKVTFYNKFE